MSNVRHQTRSGKETIHSGHFMVSHFEAEAQDEFDDLAVPVPDEEQNVQRASVVTTYTLPGAPAPLIRSDKLEIQHQQLLSIETSLTKLFRCMTLAYRQKLTSPKWNRFKGIKLRWKDKIRLNNVIWRCWHMQFIKKQNTLVCQFASPLDVDTHVKPETTILEGKYWKRRAEAVIAEYKKWRMFHITRLLGRTDPSVQDTISEMDTVESFSACSDLAGTMLTDEDYLNFMSDTLFSTITSHQPFAFPDPREIARGASLADFIQPSLGPLQPNLDDFMDTLEPLHDILSPRLPPVPEECALPPEEPLYRGSLQPAYSQPYAGPSGSALSSNMPTSHGNPSNAMMTSMQDQRVKSEQHMHIYDNNRIFTQTDLHPNMTQEVTSYPQNVTEPLQGNIYGGKSTRLQYVNAPKIVTQQDAAASNYSKYSSVIPPSQLAPETVSLLQQPHGSKYAAPLVIQGRSKGRGRLAHYGQPYAQLPAQQLQALPYDSRQSSNSGGQRQSSPQIQYLQPGPSKQTLAPSTSRTFKMPSPPLAPASQQVLQQASTSRVINPPPTKEAYRSSSLPLGAQLNADWSISAPAPESDTSRNTSRAREQATPAAAVVGPRMRSRSSSGGGGGSGSAPEARRPPPLTSVASEPTLHHSSVMLAHLLSHHQSQSSYKLASSAEDVSTPGSVERNVSPQRRQPTDQQADLSSRLSGGGSPLASPPPSPGSPRDRGERRPHAHMHAEQKRRYNIKNGFDTLQALIPHLNANPAAKVSKAAMLQKGAEYIKQLKSERNQIKEEMESLRQQIECLNNSIANCHSLLPATGAPVSRARSGRLREMFARHVANRTMHNWKYWLFSVVAGALLESFAACVSSGSGADLVRSTLLWAEQHCSLVEMRPAVLNSLRVLCTTTDILTNPERLPEEARAAVASTSSVKSEPS